MARHYVLSHVLRVFWQPDSSGGLTRFNHKPKPNIRPVWVSIKFINIIQISPPIILPRTTNALRFLFDLLVKSNFRLHVHNVARCDFYWAGFVKAWKLCMVFQVHVMMNLTNHRYIFDLSWILRNKISLMNFHKSRYLHPLKVIENRTTINFLNSFAKIFR